MPGPWCLDRLDALADAISCGQERLGHSPPLSFSAAEVQELRRETGKIRARSATPRSPTLVARAAPRLPCCQPGAGPCSSLAIPSPVDQMLLSISSVGSSVAPDPLMENKRGSASRQVLPGDPEEHREDALTLGPELLSAHPSQLWLRTPTPWQGQSQHWCSISKPHPNTSCLTGTSSQTTNRGALSERLASSHRNPAAAQLSRSSAPWC